MARRRDRIGASGLAALALGASLTLHLGAALLRELVSDPPLPRLFVQLTGQGTGAILSRPSGIACGRDCVAAFAPGTRVVLSATVGEGSTFEGWGDGCRVPGQDVLECELVIGESVHVRPRFGVEPERVQVALIEPLAASREAIKLTLPSEEDLRQVAAAEIIPPRPAPTPMAPSAAAQPRRKAVEVPDENEVAEAPRDARFLSDKNRDVAEETRAVDTNLERAVQGEQPRSEESDISEGQEGAAEDEIAQVEDVEPRSLEAARRQGPKTPAGGEAVARRGRAATGGPGVLAMRGIEGRDPLGPGAATSEAHGRGGTRGMERGRDGIDRLLSLEDYERIVGREVALREVELGRKRQSRRHGRYERKQAALRSALENFVPEVRPGNQTALKTQMAPFALYVAQMHRRIHELWGFGFLGWLDGKGASHPLNDWSLHTTIEIAVNPDGTVHKTTIVKSSGRSEFDIAALDVVYSAAPFSPTPEKIRSVDDRVWMHWSFKRNFEQCGTFNVDQFILSEVNEKRAIDDGSWAVAGKKGKKPTPPPPAGSTDNAITTAAASARAHANLAAPDDPQAQFVANLWLSGFSTANVAKLVKVSGTPFRSGTRIVADSSVELAAVYGTILEESRGRIRAWKIVSPAGYRKRFGALPQGWEDTSELAVFVQVGRERFVLALRSDGSGSYKVVGFYR